MSQKKQKIQQVLEEFTLLLMWLNRFSDQKLEGEPIWRAWKGYDFDVLNILLKKEYISFSYKSKSVLLRDKGIKGAKELLKKYQLEEKNK